MAIRLITGRNNRVEYVQKQQLMRSDILPNIDVLGRECLWSLVPLSPRGR